MYDRHPLQIAKKVGYSLAGHIGELAFVELELAYATRLLPRFSDDPITRVVQNVLLYWQRGYYKSTSLKVFSQTIPEAVRVVDITSMSVEKIFGSIDETKKHIIPPAFTNVHFVVISELTTLLGQRDTMRQFVNVMNVAQEGEKVNRQILKFGYGKISEEELSELETKGVFYDPIRAELSYTPNFCVLAATRPLDNRYFTYLNNSGYFSRYHVIQHRVTAEEASEHLHKEYKLDQNAFAHLKETNALLSKVKVKRMLRPSEALMKPVYDDLEALVRDEIAERPHLKLADVINPRLKDDVIRELVAHSFLKTAFQNGFKDIDKLHYTEEDVDFVRSRLFHFVDFAINPLIAESFTRVSGKRSKTHRVKELIIELLSDGRIRSRQEIGNYVLTRMPVSIPTFEIARKQLVSERKTCQPRYGFYKLKQDCTVCKHKETCTAVRR
jgi:hypothetical protein